MSTLRLGLFIKGRADAKFTQFRAIKNWLSKYITREKMRELNDQEKLTLAVIDRAKSNEHSKFEYIRSMAGLRAVSIYFNSVAKMKHGFQDISADVMKRYCKNLVSGSSEAKDLVTYNELKLCEKFYREEQEIAREMIREYISYVSSGHFIEFIMGFERPDEELKDYIERRK